jgi:hypothetical protein
MNGRVGIQGNRLVIIASARDVGFAVTICRDEDYKRMGVDDARMMVRFMIMVIYTQMHVLKRRDA